MIRLNFLLVISLIILTACSSDGDDDNGGNADPALEGTWSEACTYDADDDTYSKISMTFTGSNYSISSGAYSDANCSIALFTMAGEGTYDSGKEKILASGDTVKEADITAKSATLTLKNDSDVADFNTASICDKTNWQKDVAMSILACSDLGLTIKSYDIYKIDGNKLYFGDTEGAKDGKTEATRPDELETDFMTKT